MSEKTKRAEDSIIEHIQWLLPHPHHKLNSTGKEVLRSKLKRLRDAEKEEIVDTINTVFSIYLSVFPTPRDEQQKLAQEVIKVSVRRLKENLLEAINQIQK